MKKDEFIRLLKRRARDRDLMILGDYEEIRMMWSLYQKTKSMFNSSMVLTVNSMKKGYANYIRGFVMECPKHAINHMPREHVHVAVMDAKKLSVI